MLRFKMLLRRLVIGAGVRLGLRVLNDAEYRRGVQELMRLSTFIERSGSLSHPRRVMARKKIRRYVHEALSFLAVGETRVAYEARYRTDEARRARNEARETL